MGVDVRAGLTRLMQFGVTLHLKQMCIWAEKPETGSQCSFIVINDIEQWCFDVGALSQV